MSRLSIAQPQAKPNARNNVRTVTTYRRVRAFHKLRGRVYVASSMQTYGTARYDAMLSRLRTLAPEAEWLAARDLFTSNADWREQWPLVLPTLSALVFFCDDDGHIGYGTYTEVLDAACAHIPVWYLTDDDRAYRVRDASFGPMNDPLGDYDADVLLFPNVTTTPAGRITRNYRSWVTVAHRVPAAEWLRTAADRSSS